jgi:hypothetical protein
MHIPEELEVCLDKGFGNDRMKIGEGDLRSCRFFDRGHIEVIGVCGRDVKLAYGEDLPFLGLV